MLRPLPATLLWATLALGVSVLGGCATAASPAAPTHPCSGRAEVDARRLVLLHLAEPGQTAEPRIDIPRPARVLSPTAHPGDTRQKLQPLELTAYVEKGAFRVRLLYAADDRRECVPVGREIIDWTGQ